MTIYKYAQFKIVIIQSSIYQIKKKKKNGETSEIILNNE